MATWATVVGKGAEGNMVAAEPRTDENRGQGREGARVAPSPAVAQRQRLLAEALKSRTDALTGERRCLGCARGFRDLARLAQHIADKHGGVNAVPKLDAGAPTQGALRFGQVAVLRMGPARGDATHQPPVAAASTAARPPAPSHDKHAEKVKPPQRAVAAAFAAPEGTHAKRRKQPSRLKLAFRRARAQEAVGHWQSTLDAIEESLQVGGEALAAARNELVHVQQAQAAGVRQSAALPGERPGGAAVRVREQLLDRQVVLGREREEQLLSAHAAARQRLAEAQAQLLPPQPQPQPSKLSGSIAAEPSERAEGPAESTLAGTASPATRPAAEHTVPRGQPANGVASVKRAAEENESGGERCGAGDGCGDKSLPTALGGFENLQRRRAVQRKAQPMAPPPVVYEPSRPPSEPPGTAPTSRCAVPISEAAIELERAHAGSDGGSSGRSSSSGSSFGLHWGDALKGWAQAVQVESHAALQAVAPQAPAAADDNGHQYTLPTPPTSPSVAAAGSQRAEQHVVNQPLPAQQVQEVTPANVPQPLAEEAEEVDAVDVGAWLEQAIAAEPPDERLVGATQAEGPQGCLPSSGARPGPGAPHQLVAGASAALLPPLLPGEQRCAACAVVVSGQRNWEEHVTSRRHARRVHAVAAAAVDAEAPASLSTFGTALAAALPLLPRHAAAQLPSLPGIASGAAPYVTQTITPELDAAAEALLRQLLEWQRRAQLADPANARRKRRLVCGMREVHKAVKVRKAKLLVVAPNIRTVAAVAAVAEDGADAAAGGGGSEGDGECPIEGTLLLCEEHGVPVVFALSRRRLGRVVGKRRSASAFAVLEAGGAEQRVVEVLALAERARRRWREGREAW